MTLPPRDPSPPDLVLRACPRCARMDSAMEEDRGYWYCGACDYDWYEDEPEKEEGR